MTHATRSTSRRLAAVLCAGAAVLTAFSGALAAGDYSSPKAAASTFAAAIAAGDVETAKASIVPNEKQAPVVEALAKLQVAQKKFAEAAVKAYGQAGEELARTNDQKDAVKQIESAQVKEQGDVATLTSADSPDPLTLRKVDGQWKVDLGAMPNSAEMERQVPTLTGMTELMDTMATEIEDGKYKSAEEVKQVFTLKFMQKMAEQQNAEGPATQGTTTAPAGPAATEPATQSGGMMEDKMTGDDMSADNMAADKAEPMQPTTQPDAAPDMNK